MSPGVWEEEDPLQVEQQQELPQGGAAETPGASEGREAAEKRRSREELLCAR